MLRIVSKKTNIFNTILKKNFQTTLYTLKKVERKAMEAVEEDEEDEDEFSDGEIAENEAEKEKIKLNLENMKKNFKATLFGINKNQFDEDTLVRELLRTGGTFKDEKIKPHENEIFFDTNEKILKIERTLRNHFSDEKPIQYFDNAMMKKIQELEDSEVKYQERKFKRTFFNRERSGLSIKEPYENFEEMKEVSKEEILEAVEKLKKEKEVEINNLPEVKLNDQRFQEQFLHPIESINRTLFQKDDLDNFWDKEFVQKLWKFFGGQNFRSKEEFLIQIRFTANEAGVLEKLGKLLNLPEGQTRQIFDKMLKILQKNEVKFPESNELAIQRITDDITENAKPLYFKWIDRYASVDEKFYRVEKAMMKLYKQKVKKRELKETVENLSKVNRKDYDNEDDYLYDVLAPLHQPNSSTSTEPPKPKEYEPKIYGGVSEGKGRRKTSVARVWITPGTGLFTVNEKSYSDYFPHRTQLTMLSEPFNLLGTFNQFDIKARVAGGGFSSQCEAVRGGICRAVAGFIPKMGNVYAKHKLMTYDRRIVERKKPGQKKARKRFQWVKR
jgi:small subunit ribosomal protein S9